MLESDRRSALAALAAIAAAGAGSAPALAESGTDGAAGTAGFAARLAAAPRNRNYTKCPMVLDGPDGWDDVALRMVISYPGAIKQVWDNTNLGGSWLNLMRNSMNAQVFSFGHPDFLEVSATHGPAHLALFDDAMWEKYKLTDLAGDKFPTNTLLGEKTDIDPSMHQDPTGPYSPAGGNKIAVLQQRGVVFLACHNAIWEIAHKLSVAGKGEHEAIAVDLTNHLIPGVVLTPGIVATIVQLERAGFAYSA